MWELSAAVDGWNACHGAQDAPEPMSGTEFDALLERHADWIGKVQ